MKKFKDIVLEDGTIILDFAETLVVIDAEFAEKSLNTKTFIGRHKDPTKIYDWIPCAAKPFTTKKGRKAIKVTEGNSHKYRLIYGSGSTKWPKMWEKNRPVNALFASALSRSNGGGCWAECVIMEAGENVITAEQAEYKAELQ